MEKKEIKKQIIYALIVIIIFVGYYLIDVQPWKDHKVEYIKQTLNSQGVEIIDIEQLDDRRYNITYQSKKGIVRHASILFDNGIANWNWYNSYKQ